MSKFNKTTTITNHEGGKAFNTNAKLEVAMLLTTTKLTGSYYETDDERLKRLRDLIDTNSHNADFIKFVAKAILYTRKEIGLRSISHYATAYIARYLSGVEYAETFYFNTLKRTDDISETLSVYKALNNKIGSMPKAMSRGFKNWLSKADYYQASKYQMKGKDINLIDLVRLLHINNDWSKELITTGKLKPANTKEVKLSGAKNEDERNDALLELLKEGKLPYKACLMHLVKISSMSKEVQDLACELLVNPKAIKGSLVHPLEILVAYEQVLKVNTPKILVALSKAIELCFELDYDISIPGDVCVMLDISGSMSGMRAEIASIAAAIILKITQGTLVRYDDDAEMFNYNPMDSVFTLANSIKLARNGTEIKYAFDLIVNKSFDKIIIITDQQDFGVSRNNGNTLFNKWANQNNPEAHVYSCDVGGYSKSMLNTQDYRVHTFSAFDTNFVSQIANNVNSLVETIEEITL
jgi:hypothetical protein